MQDTYSYIAVVSFDDDGITILYPDLDGCCTCANDESEIHKMAKEVLALHLWGMEQDNDTIPEPSSIRSISLQENQTAVLVEVFMPPFRDRINNRVVKKTLTIPMWLNAEAERHGVNFSQLLQNSLKEYLHIGE